MSKIAEEIDYTKLAESLAKNKKFMKQVKNSIEYRISDKAYSLIARDYDINKLIKEYIENASFYDDQ